MKDWTLNKAKSLKQVGVAVVTRGICDTHMIVARIVGKDRASPIFVKAGEYVPLVRTAMGTTLESKEKTQ